MFDIDKLKLICTLSDGRMSRTEAEWRLGLSPKTLAMWTMEGKGPRCTKVGGRVFYFKADLDSFIQEGVRQ